MVEVDGSPAAHGGLVWALREAARRDATVVAVSVVDLPDDDPLSDPARLRINCGTSSSATIDEVFITVVRLPSRCARGARRYHPAGRGRRWRSHHDGMF